MTAADQSPILSFSVNRSDEIPMSDTTKPRILIVDDRADSIQIMARGLAPEFAAEFALSGKQALAKLATGELPDLILLDVVMPDMDGYEVCRQLKVEPRTRDIPVILITASNDLEDDMSAMLALVADAADFIHKPVNPQVLRQRVRTQVLLRQRERELVRLQAELDQLKAQLAAAMADPVLVDATRPGITKN